MNAAASPTPDPVVLRFPENRLRDVIGKAYELSRPQGLGFLQFEPGPLPESVMDEILERSGNRSIGLDYVLGRAVKLHISRDDMGCHIENRESWFDHDGSDWNTLRDFIRGANG